jgi:hypothetical protein
LALGLSTSIIAAIRLLPILNPATFLFRENDKAAIEWINRYIPKDETIVINPGKWGYGLFMGQDGGYWISPITDNPTIPPNVLYGLNEVERNHVNKFVEELLQIHNKPEEIWQLLDSYGYRILFIGSRGGIISPKALLSSSLFKVRYQDGTTWIFEAVSPH